MIVILIGLLLVFFGRYLIRLGHQISTELLKNLIQVETGGTYEIDFEEVSLNIRKKKLSVSKLRLIPNVDPESHTETIYEVDIDSVVMDLESLKSIYLKRELNIDSVRIIDPKLVLTDPDLEDDSSSFSSQTGDIYKIISNQLSLLSINHFQVLSGDVSHRPSNFELLGIDFNISGFLVDSTTQKESVLYSTKISVEINHQNLLLPDSIHEIGFEKFILSTKDSVLRFENAFIKPSKESQVTFDGVNNVNVYDVRIPHFEIKGIDYNKAYAENILSVEKLSIRSPQILLDDETSNKSDSVRDENNLLKLLTNVFGRVEVDTFQVDGANIDLKLYAGSGKQRLSSGRTNVELYGINLDTLNADLNKQYTYYDSATITLFDYRYDLPDSIHVLKAEQIRLSTSDRSIRVENVQLSPDKNPNSSKTLAYFNLPEGVLTGVNFEEILLGDQLVLRDFDLYDPQLKIYPSLRTKRKTQNTTTGFSVPDLYDLLKIRYSTMFSNSLSIRSGQVEIEKQGKIENININIGNISLKSNTQQWSQLIRYADINTGTINWMLDTIQFTANQLFISDKGSDIQVEQVGLGGSQLGLSFDTQSLIIRGNNIDSLTLGKFDADTVYLKRPLLAGDLDKILAYQEKDTVDIGRERILPKGINYLIVEEGSLDITSKFAKDVRLSNLNLGLSQSKTIPLERLSFKNASGSLVRNTPLDFSFASFDYEKSKRRLKINEIRVTGGDSLDFTVDNLILQQVFQKGLFYDGFFLASSLIIDGLSGKLYPEVFLAKTSRKTNPVKRPKVSLARAQLSNIKLDFPQTSQRGYARVDNGYFELENISLLDHQMLTDEDFLFGRDALISGDLYYSIDTEQLQLKQFEVTSQPYSFKLNNLVYSRDSTLNVNLKGLAIDELSIDKLRRQNELSITSVKTEASRINVIQKDQQLSKSILKLPLRMIQVDSLSSKSNDLIITDRVMSKQTEFNQLQLNAVDISLDSLTDINRWFRYVNNLEFSGRDFDEKLSEDYRVKVKTYAYQQKTNRVDLEEVHLVPEKDKYEFSSKLSTQKNWFDVTVASVSIHRPDLEGLAEGRVNIPRIDLNDAYLDVYRDKTIPFPENQYRPMPQKSLHDLKFPAWVDTVNLTADIRYSERPPNSDMEGLMTFDGIEAGLYNIRTRDTLPDINMLLKAKGRLYAAPFEVSVNFSQMEPDYSFRMMGNVTDFDLTSLNQILGPAAGVNIRSGFGESVTFNFTANDAIAEGEMRFRYDDLKIDILNKKTHEAQGLGRGIKTFFANTFVVKKKNMGFAFFVKKGQIFYERDTSRAVFNYWGKALISGAVSSVGINKSTRAQKKYRKSQDSD